MAPVVAASLPRSLATCVSAHRYSRACWGLSRGGLGVQQARLKSTPAAALVEENTAVEAPPHDDNHREELDLTFCDHQAAFRSKTNAEVVRALLVFKMCGIPYLVKNNEKVRGSLAKAPATTTRTSSCHITNREPRPWQ